ncbi:DUF1295 domain-containing protein [Candidatus Woesearchaeota archaeon]|nr:DUF1295 domain-containing protein [Candidatus Woesearchaeota archaeon]
MNDVIFYLLISFSINIILFIPAFILKTDKLTDLSYSLSFIAIITYASLTNKLNLEKIILLIMVIFWSLRLGIFLVIRIRKMSKDKRFDDIRNNFIKFGQFWLLQAIVVWIILIPSIIFMTRTENRLCIAGILIWVLGIAFETIADFQKYKFNSDTKNKGKFIHSGLWNYSRHPNYFGEILCWVGIYLTVFLSFDLKYKSIGLISPLVISLLLIKITGIPPLEKYADSKWGKNTDYKNYKMTTPILIPWFKKN